MAVAPYLFDATEVVLLTEFLSMLVLAIMWNLLAGYADIVTVGQHAFVGVGAYAFFGFTALGRDRPVSLDSAGRRASRSPSRCRRWCWCSACAPPISRSARWVVAEVLMLGAGKLEAFGGGSGISLPISIVLSLGHAVPTGLRRSIGWRSSLAAVALLVTYFLLRSRIGVGLTAMRDNEEGAAAIGVNITRARILCFLGTAPFLGMAGAIITLQKLRVAPSASFSITDFTVFIIFNVVIGGIGSFEGPIIGTVVYFVLREYLSDLGTWNLILLGTVSIVLILIDRRGLWGLFRRFLADDIVPIAHKPATAPKG